MSSNLALSVLD